MDDLPSAGDFVGPYRLVSLVARGTNACVFRAVHATKNVTVSVKVAPARALSGPTAPLESAGPSGAARVLECGRDEEWSFAAREWVEGTSLAELVRLHGRQPVARACAWARQALLAAESAGLAGGVRLQPAHLILAPTGHVQLLLGSRLPSDEAAALDDDGRAFLAPERAEGHVPDFRTTAYALGATLYFLLVGRPPVSVRNDADLRAYRERLRRETLRPVSDFRTDVPPPLALLLSQLLSHRTSERPVDAARLLTRLAPFCEGSSPPAASAPAVSAPAKTLVGSDKIATQEVEPAPTPPKVVTLVPVRPPPERTPGGDTGTPPTQATPPAPPVLPLVKVVPVAEAVSGPSVAPSGVESFHDSPEEAEAEAADGAVRSSLSAMAIGLSLAAAVTIGVAILVTFLRRGELVIATNEPNVSVAVRHQGTLVKEFDVRVPNHRVALRAGSYEIAVTSRSAERLVIDREQFTIQRHTPVVVRIDRRPEPATPPPAVRPPAAVPARPEPSPAPLPVRPPATPAVATDSRAPVPSVAEQVAARERLVASLDDELRPVRGESEQVAASRRLRKLALETTGDSSARYVLFEQAGRLALAAGDLSGYLTIVADLRERYAADVWALRSAGIRRFSSQPVSDERVPTVVPGLLELSQEAARAERFDVASEAMQAAVRLTRDWRDVRLRTDVRRHEQSLADRAGDWRQSQQALERLRSVPDDVTAHAAVGAYLCFVREEWSAGLPHLAQATPALRQAAERELAAPAGLEAKVMLAEAWMEAAHGLAPRHQQAVWQRARHWYRQALPASQGLQRARIEAGLTRIDAHLRP